MAVAQIAANACADQLQAYPAMSLADGRSTATISALVLDISGHTVPDGTRVVFTTTLGSFRDSVVTTLAGRARAILVASSTAGTATITATPLFGGGGPSTMQYEFVSDRSLLSTAREYIEVIGPQPMTYTVDTKLIGAVGRPAGETRPEQKVSVRYREVVVEADQIQLNIQSYELRAKNATLKIGKYTYPHPFSRLYFQLNKRAGYGYTTYAGHVPQFLSLQGRWFAFAFERDDGSVGYGPPPARDRFGLMQVKGEKLIPPKSQVPTEFFTFNDLAAAPSHITAKRAIIYPSRRVQFQQASIYVAETRVMSVPFYQINLLLAGSPLITEDWFGVLDNQVEINYPYYLSLRPGAAQLVRFHTNDVSSRDGATNSGAFLDYEIDWNRGDDFDGLFALRDIATNQFEIDFQQFARIDDRTTASVQFGLPLDSGYYGGLNVSHQFNGFETSLSGSASQSFRGLDVRSTDYALSTMTTPVRIKGTPFSYSEGVEAIQASNSLINETQQGYGPTANIKSAPIQLAPKANFTTSFTAAQLQGENVLPGITMMGSATISDQLSKHLSTMLSYNYTHDGFNDQVVGQHQLSSTTFWSAGKFGVHLFAMRSLDLNRETIFADTDYSVSKQWRLRGSYTYDQYLSNVDLDYTLAVTYHIGWREMGIMWSARTKRFGLLLLGATIN